MIPISDFVKMYNERHETTYKAPAIRTWCRKAADNVPGYEGFKPRKFAGVWVLSEDDLDFVPPSAGRPKGE